MALHQFDYIFVFGLIFAFLDAWNIGANDVANSFATSVSSRSLTMKQAMCIASVMEFTGAVLAGSRVADTIRNKVIDVDLFEPNPSVLMLGMMCALVGSSLWLTLATRIGLPVSTTCVLNPNQSCVEFTEAIDLVTPSLVVSSALVSPVWVDTESIGGGMGSVRSLLRGSLRLVSQQASVSLYSASQSMAFLSVADHCTRVST